MGTWVALLPMGHWAHKSFQILPLTPMPPSLPPADILGRWVLGNSTQTILCLLNQARSVDFTVIQTYLNHSIVGVT